MDNSNPLDILIHLLRWEMLIILHLWEANNVLHDFSGCFGCRLLRYWLKGEKAGTYETFAELPGWCDNVRLNEAGDFWVALTGMRPRFQEFINHHPWLRSLLVHLPIPQKLAFAAMTGFKPQAMALRYGPDGQLKEVLEDQTGKVHFASEVLEHDGKLYIGSFYLSHIVIYTMP